MSGVADNITAPRSADADALLQTGVVDPRVLAGHLRGLSLADAAGEAITDVEVRGVLKHHSSGSRCTLELAVRTAGRWRPVIAKIYNKDHADALPIMKAIAQSGFGPQDEWSIPQPLAYVPSLQCLLLEKVEGVRAEDVFKTGREDAHAAAAARAAQWLARFHARGPSVGQPLTADEHLHSSSMQKYSDEIAEQGGPCAAKAATLLERLEALLPTLSAVPMSAGHASFSPAHVILAEKRTVVFDWDGYDVADPSRDVARFLAALRPVALRRFGSVNGLDRAAEVFRSTYLAASGPERARNLRFFEAATCLNMAKHTLSRSVHAEKEKDRDKKRRKAEAMLDAGFAVLDGEAR
jgi:aminoglycoside phosphotransferase (APT) family kinase protein